MPILSIRHVTTYHYNQPVAFGEHRMMLRPRDDGDQKVLKSEIEITPAPKQLAWSQDIFGNHVAIAHFARPRRRASLCQQYSSRPCAGRFSRNRYRGFCPHLSVCLRGGRLARPQAFHPATVPACRELDRWSAMFLRKDGSADTHELLVGMTQTMRRSVRHVSRH